MAEHKHWKAEFPSDYFGSQHMPADGSDMIVKIKDVRPETIQGARGKEEKLVVYFDGAVKPDKWILNKTNGNMVEQVLGTAYMDEWIGKSIQLYVAVVSTPQGMKPAVRVREYAPQAITKEA